jgi:L-threonylcarbamoyladenylate synthase
MSSLLLGEAGLAQAADIVRRGGILVFPTETFYGLGGDARNADAAQRVVDLKGRSEDKPLPIVIGSREQLGLVTDQVSADLETLADAFWPGPLTVLVSGVAGLAPQVKGPDGMTAVRVSPHPAVQALCGVAQAPLIATSANQSGNPAVHDLADLDPAIRNGVDAVFDSAPRPAGGLASTLVRIVKPGRLVVERAGAVKVEQLRAAGFEVEAAAV